jgi:hypothetical protein
MRLKTIRLMKLLMKINFKSINHFVFLESLFLYDLVLMFLFVIVVDLIALIRQHVFLDLFQFIIHLFHFIHQDAWEECYAKSRKSWCTALQSDIAFYFESSIVISSSFVIVLSTFQRYVLCLFVHEMTFYWNVDSQTDSSLMLCMKWSYNWCLYKQNHREDTVLKSTLIFMHLIYKERSSKEKWFNDFRFNAVNAKTRASCCESDHLVNM